MSDNVKELRGLADADLVKALDAIALAKGLDRNAFVNQILGAYVKNFFNELSLVTRMCQGNPLMTESQGNDNGNVK